MNSFTQISIENNKPFSICIVIDTFCVCARTRVCAGWVRNSSLSLSRCCSPPNGKNSFLFNEKPNGFCSRNQNEVHPTACGETGVRDQGTQRTHILLHLFPPSIVRVYTFSNKYKTKNIVPLFSFHCSVLFSLLFEMHTQLCCMCAQRACIWSIPNTVFFPLCIHFGSLVCVFFSLRTFYSWSTRRGVAELDEHFFMKKYFMKFFL